MFINILNLTYFSSILSYICICGSGTGSRKLLNTDPIGSGSTTQLSEDKKHTQSYWDQKRDIWLFSFVKEYSLRSVGSQTGQSNGKCLSCLWRSLAVCCAQKKEDNFYKIMLLSSEKGQETLRSGAARQRSPSWVRKERWALKTMKL